MKRIVYSVGSVKQPLKLQKYKPGERNACKNKTMIDVKQMRVFYPAEKLLIFLHRLVMYDNCLFCGVML